MLGTDLCAARAGSAVGQREEMVGRPVEELEGARLGHAVEQRAVRWVAEHGRARDEDSRVGHAAT